MSHLKDFSNSKRSPLKFENFKQGQVFEISPEKHTENIFESPVSTKKGEFHTAKIKLDQLSEDENNNKENK